PSTVADCPTRSRTSRLAPYPDDAKREVRLRVGQSATVDGYRVTYLGSTRAVTGQKTTVKARVRIERGGDNLGSYAPAISTFPNSTEGIGTPSVHTGVLRDVYLTLVSSPNQRGRVTIGVLVNPMVVWIWIGGGVMALGTLIALAPTMRARLRRDPRRGRLASDPDGGPVAAEVREVEPV
ncbi:MAG TPA: cytochrome c-type biogenesis CcmF C-terminal domain-containing protein, partial [Acidimicrobiia bacterium]|nr:cytochrome c-type biogenesis CcmF C-terminal domain-containing protein [Acidimicrobiia bacterium]